MGVATLTDGVYVWPQGYAHYVVHHAVVPPPHFLAHVAEQSLPVVATPRWHMSGDGMPLPRGVIEYLTPVWNAVWADCGFAAAMGGMHAVRSQ